jgi:hypothetical protein
MVAECEHLVTRELGGGMPRPPSRLADLSGGTACREILFASAQQVLIVVDAHDDLDRRRGPLVHRSDRLLELRPAILRIGADNSQLPLAG